MVTSSPWSKPVRAASTMSSAGMTISSGRCSSGVPAMPQNSVAVAPGRTAWTWMFLSLSSWRRDWLKASTKALEPP